MKYVEMTIEEATKYCKGNGTVLVAVQDLENEDDDIQAFSKRSSDECKVIIEQAETIARVCDEFMNQLRVFSKKQLDLMRIEPHGKLSVILIKE